MRLRTRKDVLSDTLTNFGSVKWKTIMDLNLVWVCLVADPLSNQKVKMVSPQIPGQRKLIEETHSRMISKISFILAPRNMTKAWIPREVIQ